MTSLISGGITGDLDQVQNDSLDEAGDLATLLLLEACRTRPSFLSCPPKTISNRAGGASTVIARPETRRMENPSRSKVARTRSRTDGSATYALTFPDETGAPELRPPADPLSTTCARIASEPCPRCFKLFISSIWVTRKRARHQRARGL